MTSEDLSESSNWRSSSWSFACNIIVIIVIVINVSFMREATTTSSWSFACTTIVSNKRRKNTSKTTSGDNQQKQPAKQPYGAINRW